MGTAQVTEGWDFVVITSEQVILLQRISRMIGKAELSLWLSFVGKAWIYTSTICSHIQIDRKTGKDDPEVKVGEQDIAPVVIVEAPCECCLFE